MTPERLHGPAWPDDEALPHRPSRSQCHDNDSSHTRTSSDTIRREARARRNRKIRKAKEEIENLRSKVISNRLELREYRVELKQRRASLRQMQARFWRSLKGHWENHEGLDIVALAELYNKIDKILDESGPEEERYDEKEDDLDWLEYKLSQLENRFYDTDAKLAELGSGFTDSSSSTSSMRSQSVIPNQSASETSVTYRYLSRVGDLKIVQERLLELEDEKSQYLDIEQSRAAMGLDSYQPNVEFLATFDEVKNEHEKELQRIGNDLRELEDLKNVHENELRGIGADLRELEDSHGLNEDLQRLHTTSDSKMSSAVKTPNMTNLASQPVSRDHYSEGPRKPDHRLIPRYKSDGDLLSGFENGLTNRQRTNEWIDQSLSASAIERARHRTILTDKTASWSLVNEVGRTNPATFSSRLAQRHDNLSSNGAFLPPMSLSGSGASKPPRFSQKGGSEMNEMIILEDIDPPSWGSPRRMPLKTPDLHTAFDLEHPGSSMEDFLSF